MYELRLFNHGLDDAPFTLCRQDLSRIKRWLNNEAPHLFAAGREVHYQIWECVGTSPISNIAQGTIEGAPNL